MKVTTMQRSQVTAPLVEVFKMTTNTSGALCRPCPEAVDGASTHVQYVFLADDEPVL